MDRFVLSLVCLAACDSSPTPAVDTPPASDAAKRDEAPSPPRAEPKSKPEPRAEAKAEPKPEPSPATTLTLKTTAVGPVELGPTHCAVKLGKKTLKVDGDLKRIPFWFVFLADYPMKTNGEPTGESTAPTVRLGMILYGPKGVESGPLPPVGTYAIDPNDGDPSVPHVFEDRVDNVSVEQRTPGQMPMQAHVSPGEGQVEITASAEGHLGGTIRMKGDGLSFDGAFDLDCVIDRPAKK